MFDSGARKVACYQQYFRVRAILERVATVDADCTGPGGVVWHTQGSGRSLIMVMLAEALLETYSSKGPRIVMVTGRVGLEDEIYGTFAGTGLGAPRRPPVAICCSCWKVRRS